MLGSSKGGLLDLLHVKESLYSFARDFSVIGGKKETKVSGKKEVYLKNDNSAW